MKRRGRGRLSSLIQARYHCTVLTQVYICMTLTKLLVPHKIPEWERPAMAPPPLGSSGSGDSDRSDNDDEKVAMECFYGLIREATRTCYGMRPCPPLLSVSISLPTSIDDYI